MAKLILTSGEQRQEFELAAINTIGRHPDNTIQILDRIISKEHAQILRGGDGRFLLRDLGSLERHLRLAARGSPSIVLKHGDEIMLGSTHLMFVEHTETEESLNRVTIAPRRSERSSARRSTRPRRTATFCPRSRSSTSSTCAATTRSCASPTSSAAPSSACSTSRSCCRRSSTRRSSCSPPTAASSCSTIRTASSRRATSSTRPGATTSRSCLSKSIIAEVEQQKKARAVVGRDDGLALLRRALDHHAGHPLDHERAAAPRRRAARHHAPRLADRDQRLHREGSAALHRHRRQAAVAIQNARLARKIEHETKTRAQFQRLLSPNLVEQVVAGKLQLEKGGALREVTILFSDIRGFTSMSEKTRAGRRSSSMLNEYFELMVDILFKHAGHARQVRRRRDHGAVRRAGATCPTRRSRRCAARSTC